MDPVDLPRISAAVKEILIAIGEDPERDGLQDTPDRVARMYAELQAALKAPDIQEKFKGQGAEVGTLGPVPFGAYIREELVRWGKVVKASGAKLD